MWVIVETILGVLSIPVWWAFFIVHKDNYVDTGRPKYIVYMGLAIMVIVSEMLFFGGTLYLTIAIFLFSE